MICFKFLFDPQSGSYQGIVREPYPDNSTYVQPHFSVGYKTCWDFSGKWKLVKEEEFFKQVLVQDVLKEYNVDLRQQCQSITNTISILSNKQMKEFYDVSRSNILEHQRTRSVLSEQYFYQREELKRHLEGLQRDLIIVQERIENIFDILTLGPLKRQVRRLMTWLGL